MFLCRQGVLLKDFGRYVEQASGELKAHAQRLAQESGRPFLYLASATTKRSGESKEDLARALAARDGIEEGLVCVLSVLEPCRSFGVQGNRDTHQLEVVQRDRKCLGRAGRKSPLLPQRRTCRHAHDHRGQQQRTGLHQ